MENNTFNVAVLGAVMAKADGLDGSVVSKLVREKIS